MEITAIYRFCRDTVYGVADLAYRKPLVLTGTTAVAVGLFLFDNGKDCAGYKPTLGKWSGAFNILPLTPGLKMITGLCLVTLGSLLLVSVAMPERDYGAHQQ